MADVASPLTAVLRRLLRMAPLLFLVFTAVLPGCDDVDPTKPIQVTIKGEKFDLELALDDAVRMKGLGDRESVDAHGGMFFGFHDKERKFFVMRDCKCDIDIMFLSDAGRVLKMHEMKVEDARRDGESDDDYDGRLKRYGSDFATRFVIELKGGRMKELGIKVGDVIEFDAAALKKAAK